MTEWYTHYDAKEFSEVRNVQETLLLPEAETKSGKDKTKQGGSSNETRSPSKSGNRGKRAVKPEPKTGRVKKQA
jgi:hypothetical protein